MIKNERTDTNTIYCNSNNSSIPSGVEVAWNFTKLLFLSFVKPVSCCIKRRKLTYIENESKYKIAAFLSTIPRLVETRNWPQYEVVENEETLQWVKKFKQKYDQTEIGTSNPLDEFKVEFSEDPSGNCLAISLYCIKKFLEEQKININSLKSGWLDQLKEIAHTFDKGGTSEVVALQAFSYACTHRITKPFIEKFAEVDRKKDVIIIDRDLLDQTRIKIVKKINDSSDLIEKMKFMQELKPILNDMLNLAIQSDMVLKEHEETMAHWNNFLNNLNLESENKNDLTPGCLLIQAQLLDLEIKQKVKFTVETFLNKIDEIKTDTPALLTLDGHAILFYKGDQTIILDPNQGLLLCDKAAIKSTLLVYGKIDSTLTIINLDLMSSSKL